MKKIAIVYWSGTGNTEKMAVALAEGVKDANVEVTLLNPYEFSAEKLSEYDVVAFGCSSMGVEQLEDIEFEPMFADIENSLNGRKLALFGSYGWGDGQWMRDWLDRCKAAGAILFDELGLIVCEAPDADALDACRELGRSLAEW